MMKIGNWIRKLRRRKRVNEIMKLYFMAKVMETMGPIALEVYKEYKKKEKDSDGQN